MNNCSQFAPMTHPCLGYGWPELFCKSNCVRRTANSSSNASVRAALRSLIVAVAANQVGEWYGGSRHEVPRYRSALTDGPTYIVEMASVRRDRSCGRIPVAALRDASFRALLVIKKAPAGRDQGVNRPTGACYSNPVCRVRSLWAQGNRGT